jgi:hypothetical protein
VLSRPKEGTELKTPLFSSAAGRWRVANGRCRFVMGLLKRPEQPHEAQASKPLQILLFGMHLSISHVHVCLAPRAALPHRSAASKGYRVGEMLTDGLVSLLRLSATHHLLLFSFESKGQDFDAGSAVAGFRIAFIRGAPSLSRCSPLPLSPLFGYLDYTSAMNPTPLNRDRLHS